jgi:hypothetical protein
MHFQFRFVVFANILRRVVYVDNGYGFVNGEFRNHKRFLNNGRYGNIFLRVDVNGRIVFLQFRKHSVCAVIRPDVIPVVGVVFLIEYRFPLFVFFS